LLLLSLARVARPIHHSFANGVSLGAEASERLFKVLCLDVGLWVDVPSAILGDREGGVDRRRRRFPVVVKVPQEVEDADRVVDALFNPLGETAGRVVGEAVAVVRKRSAKPIFPYCPEAVKLLP
jgi:hypothetical protein